MNEVYLCLGGNLGNCLETFEKTILSLEKGDIVVTKRSSVYLSEAWGMTNAPDFHNLVIAVNTGVSAQELMQLLLKTEKKSGRERNETGTYQSRVIDLDILFYNGDIIHKKELEIPHPRLHLRRFVLEPLNEIAPEFVHPLFNKTIAQLLAVCPDKSVIKKSENAF
jgi:2-amino-4-hydroxy-6-hydroxymethyldihydropteridine diphosphokinase